MHILNFLILPISVALATTATSPSAPAKTGCDKYRTDAQGLAEQANKYTGSSNQNLAIRNQFTKISDDIDALYSNWTNSPSSNAQANATYTCVCGPLFTDVSAALTAVKNAKATFTANGLRGEILQTLKDLKARFDRLLDAYIAKAPSAAWVSKFQTCKGNYDGAFNDCITAYS